MLGVRPSGKGKVSKVVEGVGSYEKQELRLAAIGLKIGAPVAASTACGVVDCLESVFTLLSGMGIHSTVSLTWIGLSSRDTKRAVRQ